jgi:hypothetical protein
VGELGGVSGCVACGIGGSDGRLGGGVWFGIGTVS